MNKDTAVRLMMSEFGRLRLTFGNKICICGSGELSQLLNKAFYLRRSLWIKQKLWCWFGSSLM